MKETRDRWLLREPGDRKQTARWSECPKDNTGKMCLGTDIGWGMVPTEIAAVLKATGTQCPLPAPGISDGARPEEEAEFAGSWGGREKLRRIEPAEAGRARRRSSPVGSSSRGPSLSFTSCPHPSTFTSQLGSPVYPSPRCSGGDQEMGTEPLYSTGHNKVLATSASNPRPQRKKPRKTGVGGVPTSGSKAPGSPREKPWGRREDPTPRGKGRWPPPHPTPGAPLTGTAARESAGKLGLPYPSRGLEILLCSVRGGGRWGSGWGKKGHRGEVSRRSQSARTAAARPLGFGPPPPGAVGSETRRPRAGSGGTGTGQGAEGGAGSARVPRPAEATYVCC